RDFHVTGVQTCALPIFIDLQTCAAGWMQQRLAAEQGGDARTFRHVQLAQGRADTPFAGAQTVNEDLPLARGVNLQPGTRNRRWRRRDFHLGLLDRKSTRLNSSHVKSSYAV